MTGWDEPATPTVAVLGPRALTQRLGRTGVVVHRLLPTAVAVDEVDAVLLARSAVMDGSWAGALQPTGFDRGVVLARLLRAAAERSTPVVLVEDLPPDAVDGWHGMLDGAVDEALVLGPVGAGERCWHPGLHWDTTALRLAVACDATDDHTAVDVTSAVARGEWRWAQRRAAHVGRATIDRGDPWSLHLASELLLLGVDVRDGAGEPVRLRDDATPAAAVTWLCDHLDLPSPPGRPASAQTGDGTSDGTACRTALDRLGGDADVAVRLGGALVAGTDLDRAAPSLSPAGAIDLGGLA